MPCSSEPALPDLVAITALRDPLARARAAQDEIYRLRTLTSEASLVRREAIRELLDAGWSQTAIGDLLGLTRARISQLL